MRIHQALFNFILREYGVKDVKVKEVLGLEDGDLSLLPYFPSNPLSEFQADLNFRYPVYGLIFLFKYWDEEDEEAEELPKCPNHVWFANQVSFNALHQSYMR
jgi:ubiquitin carboxyl-terminal hydrolase L5